MNRGRYQKGVTAIEDLIDMDKGTDDTFNVHQIEESPLGERVNKYIRKTDRNALNMAINGNIQSNTVQEEPKYNYNIEDEYPPIRRRIRDPETHYIEPYNVSTQHQQQHHQQQLHKITCPDVFEHISNCPICSKIYNQDKTIYIFFIVILSIIIIILLKQLFK